ncbi:MAG: hypothetical protein KatS3mg110_4115 [Pirellulaceae bacterium]|nr:MAG: hypothetical protein KatS3mg110_4115 [Pirellulaceae bacterium]
MHEPVGLHLPAIDANLLVNGRCGLCCDRNSGTGG